MNEGQERLSDLLKKLWFTTRGLEVAIEAETKVSMLDERAYSGLILLRNGPGIITIGFDWAITCSTPLHPSSPLNTLNKFSSIQHTRNFHSRPEADLNAGDSTSWEGKSSLSSHSESPTVSLLMDIHDTA